METRDDTIHPIQHVGNVPFGEKGNQTYIKKVLHVPTITKSLVAIGQIVEQGMKFTSTTEGALLKKKDDSLPAVKEKVRCSSSILTR